MKIIGITGQKGGTGKTTVAVNLARWFVNQGYQTTLIDRDPQAGAANWAQMGDGFPFAVFDDLKAELRAVLSARRKEGDQVVIVDTPPSIGGAFQEIPDHADLILLTCRPTGIDFTSLVTAIQTLKKHHPKQKLGVVLTQMFPRFRITQEILEAFEELGIPQFATRIHSRTVFQTSYTDGKTVFDCGKNPGAKEIAALGQEICQQLKLRSKKK